MELYSQTAEIACPAAAEDIATLVSYAAAVGIAVRDDDHDAAVDAWERLPQHLRDMVNAEVEKQLVDEDVPHGS